MERMFLSGLHMSAPVGKPLRSTVRYHTYPASLAVVSISTQCSLAGLRQINLEESIGQTSRNDLKILCRKYSEHDWSRKIMLERKLEEDLWTIIRVEF